MNKLLAAAFGFALGTIACAAPALAAPIECPVSSARRTITTTLPSGWWTTPIINSLTNTRVQTVGGEPTLVCEYGPAGAIMRRAPEGERCTARSGGFNCVGARPAPPPPPPSVIHRSGNLRATLLQGFELDNGVVRVPNVDFTYGRGRGDAVILIPAGGARLWAHGERSFGQATCAASRPRMSDARVIVPAVGTWVCYVTSEGRFGEFRVIHRATGTPPVLSIDYTTWR